MLNTTIPTCAPWPRGTLAPPAPSSFLFPSNPHKKVFPRVPPGVPPRLRKDPLGSVGWRLNGGWARELGWGVLVGGGAMLVAAGLIWAMGGITWQLDAARSLRGLSLGFGLYILVALWEENLFRGFVFQRLVDGLGEWPAQLILALLFGIAHWGNPGMHGATKP